MNLLNSSPGEMLGMQEGSPRVLAEIRYPALSVVRKLLLSNSFRYVSPKVYNGDKMSFRACDFFYTHWAI